MAETSSAHSPFRIATLSRQCLVWLGLQEILESSSTVMVVHSHRWRTADGFSTEAPPDVVILDLETERDAVGTITQIRRSAPASKIVLLCGLEDKDHTREAFACGVDGIILKMPAASRTRSD